MCELGHPVCYEDRFKDDCGTRALTKKPAAKELTVAEISKLLGYEVKVVK